MSFESELVKDYLGSLSSEKKQELFKEILESLNEREKQELAVLMLPLMVKELTFTVLFSLSIKTLGIFRKFCLLLFFLFHCSRC